MFVVVVSLYLTNMCFLFVISTEDGRTRGGLAAYIVSGGADQCRVGYLPQEYDQFCQMLDGRLMQVTEVYNQSNSYQKQQRAARYSRLCVEILVDCIEEFELTQVNNQTDGYLTNSTEEGETDRIARALDRGRRRRIERCQQIENNIHEFKEAQRQLIQQRGPMELNENWTPVAAPTIPPPRRRRQRAGNQSQRRVRQQRQRQESPARVVTTTRAGRQVMRPES